MEGGGTELPELDADRRSEQSMGMLGMKLFIMSLSVLFAASMAGYLVVRLRADVWPPPGMPRLPPGLWISTLILIGCSAAVETALRAARAGAAGRTTAALAVTLALAVAFLLSQVLNWAGLVGAAMPVKANLYAFTFYMLTGLHGAHVVGGLVPLIVVTAKARRGRYSAASHPGVKYCAMYWHFLDAVWIVMFAVLQLAA